MSSAVCRSSVAARAAPAPRSVSLRAPRAVPMVARSPAVARRTVITRAEEAAKEAPKEEEPKVHIHPMLLLVFSV